MTKDDVCELLALCVIVGFAEGYDIALRVIERTTATATACEPIVPRAVDIRQTYSVHQHSAQHSYVLMF